MALRSEMDLVFDEALKKLSTKRAEVSGHLSDQLSDGMLAQLVSELATKPAQAALPAPQDTGSPKEASSPNGEAREDFLA